MDEFVVESPVERPGGSVDPRRALLLPLWRGRRLVLGAMLLGLVGGLLFGIGRPNSYRSVGKLMIRAGAREELTPEMSVTGSGYGGGGRNVVNDEMHLLNATQVFEEAARIVTPAALFRPYDPSEMDDADTSFLLALFHDGQAWWFRQTGDSSDRPGHELDGCEQCVRAAALVLSRNISVRPEPGSNVITVSYVAHSPALARDVVKAFLEAAIAQHRRIYDTNATLEFLGTQLEDALKDLTQAENQFTNFKTECGVFDFETQQQALVTEIQTLEGQTASDQWRLEELREGTAALKTLVASLPETLEEPSDHNMVPNPDRALLRQHMITLENSLFTLERTPGGTTRDREIQREGITQLIESTRKDLEKMPEFVDSGPSVRRISNPRRDRLTQNLDDATNELVTLEAAAAVRAGHLRDAKEKLQKIVLCEPQFHSFEATTNQARHRYEGFRTAHERASLMGSMDQLEMSNLRRIEEATLPSQKEGPMRGKLLVLGILLGGVAGCGLALGKNLLDHRLHDVADVEAVLGTPVLALLPQPPAPPEGQPRAQRRVAL